jgi:hypothetical protein
VTVSLSYDATLSRVVVAVTALPAYATHIKVERSVNEVQWTTVRGAAAAPVTATAATVYDYEFSDSVPNFYRVTALDIGAAAYVAAGVAAAGDNPATQSPALPAGVRPGDLILVEASTRNSVIATPPTVAGYTLLIDAGNLRVFGKYYVTGDPAPTVTFTGGAAGDTGLSQTAALRRVGIDALGVVTQSNASAQNIAYPAVDEPDEDGAAIVRAAWKQDDITTVSAPTGFTVIATNSSTAGNDAANTWHYLLQTTAAEDAAGSQTVTGGAAALSRAAALVLPGRDQPVLVETADITPQLVSECSDLAVWLKSISRPFLNRAVRAQVARNFTVARDSRTGVFDIVGRSYPIAVAELRRSREWTLYVETRTVTEADDLELMLSLGDVLFVHVPGYCDLPGGYYVAGDVSYTWINGRPDRRRFTLPLTEVAPPGPDVTGTIGTWATVMATYATWADVMAAHPDWADLLTLSGTPADVVVP